MHQSVLLHPPQFKPASDIIAVKETQNKREIPLFVETEIMQPLAQRFNVGRRRLS
jgi:hypothetical protein